MANRLNTKFVFILTGVLVAAVVAFGAFYMTFVHKSPQELELRGDQYMAGGEIQLAVENYGRALRRQQTNVQLIGKYVDALEQLEARTAVDARRYLGQIQEHTRRATELRPDDDQLLGDFYQMLYDHSNQLGGAFTQRLYELSSERVRLTPDNMVARRYRGISQTQLLNMQMPRDQQIQARDDLEAVLEHDANDPVATFYLSQWNVFEARRLRANMRPPSEYMEPLKLAMDLSQLALEIGGDNPIYQLRHLQTMLQVASLDDQRRDELFEAVRDKLAELEMSLLTGEAGTMDELVVLPTANLIIALDQERLTDEEGRVIGRRGLNRAIALLEKALEHDPNNILYLTQLGRYEREAQQPQRALARFAQVREMGVRDTAIRALRSAQLQEQAIADEADMLLVLVVQQEQEDPQAVDREQVFAEVDKLVEELRRRNPDSPRIDHLIGKKYYIQQEFARALQYLDRASNRYNDMNAEVLRLAADCCQRLNQITEATRRLEQYLRLQPTHSPFRIQLINLYMRDRQFDRAQQQLNRLREIDPENPQIPTVETRLLATTGQAGQAIERYMAMDPLNNPDVLRQLVVLLLSDQRQDEAMDMLRQRLQREPTDMASLELLLNIEPDLETRQSLLATAEQAGADATTLARLNMRFGREEAIETTDSIEEMVARETDPFRKAVGEAQLAMQQGEYTTAHRKLEEAYEVAELDDAKNAIRELQFNWAIQQQHWDNAQRVVDYAVRANMDLAQGGFFKGRLHLARGQVEQAIQTLRQAVNARPVFDEGHRLLGDALAQRGDMDDAIASYEAALRQRRSNTQAIRGMVAVLDQRGEHQRALDLIKQALSFEGGNPQIISLYLDYEQQHGDREQALRLRRQIAEINPENVVNRRNLTLLYAQLEQMDEALAAAEQLIEDHGRTRQNVLTLARLHQIGGQPQQGAQALQNYIDSLGDDATADDHALLARFLLGADLSDQAMAVYRRARDLEDPQAMPISRELADLYYNAGQFERAEQYYKRILENAPDDVNVVLRLSELYINLERYDEAAQVLNQTQAGGVTARALQARIAHGRGQRNDALRLLDQTIREAPNDTRLLMLRARMLAEDETQQVAAMRDLTRALGLQPNLFEARQMLVQMHLRRGEVDDALRELRTLVDRFPNVPQPRLQLAELYINRGDHFAARRVADQGAGQFPQDAIWPRLQARVAQMANDLPRAITHWRRAVELAPTTEHIGSYGTMLLLNDQPDVALQVLREYPDRVNREPLLQAVRGRALAQSGQQAQAEQVFQNALSAAGNFAVFAMVMDQSIPAFGPERSHSMLDQFTSPPQMTWAQVIQARLEVVGRSFETALQRLRQVADAIDANDRQLQFQHAQLLALCLHQSGSYTQAREAYEQVLAMNPNDFGSLNNIAYLMASELDQAQQALPYARRAVEQNPQSPEALDTLGLIQLRIGQLVDARETLERSYELQPLPANSLHLGELFIQTNQPERARGYLERAIALAEENDEPDIATRARAALAQLN